MPSGGHARSGPAPDPSSERSERRGVKFTALPASGYDGPIPEFPLPRRSVWGFTVVDKARLREFDADATNDVAAREAELWAWAWRTPQAAAWAQTSESWRIHSVAMWVRTAVLCESGEATAADRNSLHRFADDVGLTPSGLRANGWLVAKDEVGERRAEQAAAAKPKSSRSRMKVVAGGAG